MMNLWLQDKRNLEYSLMERKKLLFHCNQLPMIYNYEVLFYKFVILC